MKKTSLVLCFFISFSSSEEFRNLKIEGLSSPRILSIAQDSTGFVWLGTDEGLNRYDGYKNIVYRSNIFDEKTLSGNRVWITHIDQNNTVWVGTDRGVCYYNQNTDSFQRIETESRPIHVLEDQNYIFFTTTNDGVFRVVKETKEVKNYQFDPLDPFSLSSSKFSEKQKQPLALDGDILWIGTTNGLNKTSMKTGQTKRLYSGKTNLVKGDTVYSVLVVNDVLYVGTTGGLGVSDLAFGADINEEKGKADNSKIISLFQVKEPDIIAAVLKEEVLIIERGKVTQKIKTENPLNKATSLETGQFLLTSTNHTVGLFITANQSSEILHETTKVPIKAKEILVDKELGIWMVGEGEIQRAGNTKKSISRIADIKPKKDRFSRTDKELFVLEASNIFSYKNNKTTRIIKNLKRDALNNSKIFVSDNNEIFLYDKNLEKVTEGGKVVELASFTTTINTVASDDQSIYLSFKNSGIAHYNKKSKKITDYRKNRLQAKLLPLGATSFFLEGSTLWIGSDESGLYELDMANPATPRLIKHHKYEKENPRSFSSSSVSFIGQHLNQLVVGTNGDGVFVYDKGGFDQLSIKDGMPSNNIISLVSSSDTAFWALTNGGLALVDWKNKNINILGEEEGLGEFFRDKSALIPKPNGGVYVVSPSGLQSINTGQLYTNEYEASVVVESVQLVDKNNKKHRIQKTNIKATYKKPTIKINLTAPAIYKAEKTTFTYFIDGYHSEWVDNGSRRYIELQGLDPGSYTIKIKSYNSDGYESINTASLNFQVLPPWWKTWWAYFLYTSTVLGLFAYYVSYQKKAQAKATEEKRKEEELEQARQFQLDMLPRKTPDDLGLDISATIETASEVGGDYYDYFPQKDKQSLYVVVGDATGHGMTAGMMVSITKAGLYGIPAIPPNDIAKRLNRVIKNIDLGWNRMAFNMARIWDNKVEFTSAAMPPVYHYHSNTGEVDEVLLGGLPLGSIKDETFALEEFDFNIGDSLVFISDGLPEAENGQGEMLGYEAVYNCVKANGKESAEEQKQALLDLGSAWLGELRNQDDITIVVVKKSNSLD